MRVAVYSGTRKVYEQMLFSSKSLLMHSNVEKIYFLIEDDIFPYETPEEIECINVSNQTFFPSDGPNYKTVCTYMVLMRAAYTKLFPKLDKILSIDIDTVVNENISNLWDIDLTNYYLAGCIDKYSSELFGSRYINFGVVMLNLQKLREDKIDDKIIYALNNFYYRFAEQCCFHEFCKDKTLILPSDYNSGIIVKDAPHHEKITHFAGFSNYSYFPHFNYYKNLDSNDFPRNVQDELTLDIIIPTYKNKEGLYRTLKSIPEKSNVNIIVIDDCSNLDYSDVLFNYPNIKFYQLDKNSGPGVARQYGIEHSNGTYMTFLDTGDYFYENGLETILKTIKENSYIKLYTFSCLRDDNNVLYDEPTDKMIGGVYKRSFIEMCNIHFCAEGSYMDEDYGFIRACKIILKFWENKEFPPQYQHIKIPVFVENIARESLTKGKNNFVFYDKFGISIIINGLHAIKIAEKMSVPITQLIKEYNHIFHLQYIVLIYCAQNKPQFVEQAYNTAYNYYWEHFRKYSHYAREQLIQDFNSNHLKSLINNYTTNKKYIPININRFLNELETSKECPNYYLTCPDN